MITTFSKLLRSQARWFEQQQTSILSAASIISITSVVSALSGLIIKRTLNGLFFDTPTSQAALEAFWVAFQIPDMMFQLVIIGALSAAFIPIFTQQKKHNQDQAFKMSSIMMNTLLSVFVVLGVIIFVFAEQITRLRTGTQFSEYQIEVVTNLTRIMILAQFFFAVSNFMTGILQSFQRFVLPAVAPILYNFGILVGVLTLHQQFGIYSAGIGVLIGAFAHMIIQIPLVIKLGFKYTFSFNFKYPGIGEFFRLMPPRVMSIGANEIRKLALGFFATSLGNLSFYMMQLALTLMAIPIRFFGVSISQASLPFLSDQSDAKSRQTFRRLVIQSLHQITFFSLPASVLLLILRVPAVRLIFGTANFPWTSTVTTSRLVAIISISITFQAMVHLLIRAFYAMKDTKTPLYISAVDSVLYLLFCAIFVFWSPMGVFGIAIATTLTAVTEFVLYLLFFNLKIGGLLTKEFWWPQLKMWSAAFLMAVFLYLPFKILDEVVFETSRTIELIGLTITTGTIGMVVYVYFAALFNVRELAMLSTIFSGLSSWRQTLSTSNEVLIDSSVDGDGV